MHERRTNSRLTPRIALQSFAAGLTISVQEMPFANITTDTPIGEAGNATMGTSWKTIGLTRDYKHPVVIAGLSKHTGKASNSHAVPRIRNIHRANASNLYGYYSSSKKRRLRRAGKSACPGNSLWCFDVMAQTPGPSSTTTILG